MPSANSRTISSSTVRMTCWSSRRGTPDVVDLASRNSLRSSSAESSSAARGLIGPILASSAWSSAALFCGGLSFGELRTEVLPCFFGLAVELAVESLRGRLMPGAELGELDVVASGGGRGAKPSFSSVA